MNLMAKLLIAGLIGFAWGVIVDLFFNSPINWYQDIFVGVLTMFAFLLGRFLNKLVDGK